MDQLFTLCPFQRKVPRSGTKYQPKILTQEEWTRINDHLLNREKIKSAEDDKASDGYRKKKILPVNRSLKFDRTRESWLNNDTAPDLESLKKRLKSETHKEEIIIRAKTILFENKDYARRLLRGLRLSTVLHERNSQIVFNQRLKHEKEIKENEMRIKLRQEMVNYEEELKLNRVKKIEKIETFKKLLDGQIHEKTGKEKLDEEEKAKERRDLLKMREEIKILTEEERLAREKKKQKFRQDIENYTKMENEIRNGIKMKEKEEEEANKIYQTVAWEIDNKRRIKEKDRFRTTRKRDVQLPKEPLKTKTNADEKLKEFLSSREKTKNALLNDLLISKKAAEEELEKRAADYKQERKRSSQQRRRKEEADRMRIRKERDENRKIMKNTMKYYIMQWMEKEEEKKREKQIDLYYIPDFSKENELINKYCDEILALVKCGERPLYPVVAAVREIKREFGLQREKNCSFLKSNVPLGSD